MIDPLTYPSQQAPYCTYEQPLCERMRLFMRLESMFAQMRDFHLADEYYTIKLFLDALFDVLDFLHRYEIRAEILNELQRLQSAITRDRLHTEMIAMTQPKLEEAIHLSLQTIYDVNLNLISNLRENELFNSLRQRNFNQSGNCLFEVPAYQFWLAKNGGESNPFLIHCHRLFASISEAIALVLRIIRASAVPTREYSDDGMFLRTLNRDRRNQMLRVHLTAEDKVFPRISGNNHRLAIRFMEQENPQMRSTQTEKPLAFSLQICSL